MADVHVRFRGLLPGWVGEWLTPEDMAWCEAHMRECAECAALAEWLRARLPMLADEAGHVPVSLLAELRTQPDSLSALERELVERHLGECELCRGDAEVIPGAGLRLPLRRRHDWRWWSAAAAVAAALLMFVRVRETNPPEHATMPAPLPGAAPAAPAVVHVPRVVFVDLQRESGAPVAVAEDSLRGETDTLEVVLPTLFVDGPEPARLTIRRVTDGLTASRRDVPVAGLARPLRFVNVSGAWRAGDYELTLVPRARSDSLATRAWRFRLH